MVGAAATAAACACWWAPPGSRRTRPGRPARVPLTPSAVTPDPARTRSAADSAPPDLRWAQSVPAAGRTAGPSARTLRPYPPPVPSELQRPRVRPRTLETRRGGRMPRMAERQRIASGSPFEPTIGFSRAGAGGGPRHRVGYGSGGGGWALSRRCGRPGAALLRDHHGGARRGGSVPDDVVRTRMYITAVVDADAVGAVHGETLRATCAPRRPWSSWRDCSTPPGRWRSKPRRCCPESGAALRSELPRSGGGDEMLVPRRSPTSPDSMRFMT